MNAFLPEPPHLHDRASRIGVLLINLGTPQAPTAAALRPYLRQFLSDPRVVEIPRLLWWPILHGIILTFRPAKSARKYAQIWGADGSPLRSHTAAQTEALKTAFNRAGFPELEFAWAMRYGEPAIDTALGELRERGCDRIFALPLYPQYAASTTGSALDALGAALSRRRNLPALRVSRGFHDHPAYIAALASSVQAHWQQYGRADRLVMSFHGVPRRSLELGDPYHCECLKSARLLAERLGLGAQDYLVSFQSRFGRAKWLEPYTQPSLEALARQGVGRVDLICPGFVSDCLETLEEIALECKAAFLAAGGREFHYIACLNERPEWIDALLAIVRPQIGDWLAHPAISPTELALRRERALAAGAGQ